MIGAFELRDRVTPNEAHGFSISPQRWLQPLEIRNANCPTIPAVLRISLRPRQGELEMATIHAGSETEHAPAGSFTLKLTGAPLNQD
jgi:hypothetical protein